MATIWFAILAVMLGMYIVLDGFDFGVGAQYLWVARKDKERRAVLNAIGPLWDGNEVWLIASGGVLFFAFPLLYASAFSGLYLALFMVLWLLILRGLAIELRHHVHHHLWGEFWDVIFSAASLGLALLFGVALGNLLRGVPLNEQGYFFVALWTNLLPYADPQGILDWFTVMIGLLGVAALIMHGGNFLAFKVGQPVGQRAARTASLAYWPVVALTVAAVVITPLIQPLVVQRTSPTRRLHSADRGRGRAGYVGVPSARQGAACRHRLRRLHPFDDRLGGLWHLPEFAHRHHRSGPQPDD